MGRTRTKQKKSPYITDSSGDVAIKSEPPIEALLGKAQDLLVQCDFELAGRFVDRVLQRSPHHAEAKEILGVIQLETGDLEGARQVRDLVCTFDCDINMRCSKDVRIAATS